MEVVDGKDSSEAKEPLIINQPVFSFRCPQGHTWSGVPWTVEVVNLPSSRSGPLCPYCYVAWMNEHFPASLVQAEEGERKGEA